MATAANLIQRGTRGSQPAATAVSIGTLYCITDESNLVERSNGTAWQSYSASGAGTGTVTNTGTLTSGALVKGNSGVDVTTATTGTGVLTALGTNVGTAGAFVTNGGALGTPSSGDGSNLTNLSAANLTGVVPRANGGVLAGAASVATDESTTSGTYADLSTSGPSVTLTTGTTVIVWISAITYSATTVQTGSISVDVSGATTIAASDTNASQTTTAVSGGALVLSRVMVLTVTAGSNTFKLQYKRSGGTFNFYNRSIAVLAL